MSDDELATLLNARPDLLDPLPEDIAQLASRSTTLASITQAIDELNSWLRIVTEALSALPDPASVGDVAAMLGQSKTQVGGAAQQLRERALLWGNDDQLHLVRPAREAFQPLRVARRAWAPTATRPRAPS